MRRDIGTDDPRVKVRPGRGSRPRTKIRPDHSAAQGGEVVGVDRGRYRVMLHDGRHVTAVKARELGRGSVVVGDRVRVTGDISGKKDTLARIVSIDQRTSQLLRSTDEGNGRERCIVANAQQLAIVTALADPAPKTGMIDRCIVAAYDAGMKPLLILTKADLASPDYLLETYEPLGVQTFTTNLAAAARADGASTGENNVPARENPAEEDNVPTGKSGASAREEQEIPGGLTPLRRALAGLETVLIGHSGVGKSTLINALVPDADRATGNVNAVTGKGRHTSASAVSLPLPEGGRIIDTPGVRSFGLAHISSQDILKGFTDLAAIAENCPRACGHAEDSPECALSEQADPRQVTRVESFRRLLAACTNDWS